MWCKIKGPRIDYRAERGRGALKFSLQCPFSLRARIICFFRSRERAHIFISSLALSIFLVREKLLSVFWMHLQNAKKERGRVRERSSANRIIVKISLQVLKAAHACTRTWKDNPWLIQGRVIPAHHARFCKCKRPNFHAHLGSTEKLQATSKWKGYLQRQKMAAKWTTSPKSGGAARQRGGLTKQVF